MNLVCAKKGWKSTYIYALVGELWKYSCTIGHHLDSIHVLLHKYMPYIGTLSIQKL